MYWTVNARDAEGRVTQEILGNGLITTRAYDNLNRLTSSVRAGITKTASHDEIGNLLSRSEIGTYAYAGAGYAGTCGGAHRVCSTSGTVATTFSYDANGNQLSGNGGGQTWSAANYPLVVTKDSSTETFLYSTERERVRRVQVEGGQTTTSVYLNPRINLGGIRGQATPAERESLHEEGIEVMPLPLPAALKEPLQ